MEEYGGHGLTWLCVLWVAHLFTSTESKISPAFLFHLVGVREGHQGSEDIDDDYCPRPSLRVYLIAVQEEYARLIKRG